MARAEARDAEDRVEVVRRGIQRPAELHSAHLQMHTPGACRAQHALGDVDAGQIREPSCRQKLADQDRALEPGAAFFYFEGLPLGLQEVTYAVRATTAGTFTLAPAHLDSARDDRFVARSASFELRVVD